ncbi:MAG TPA: hypothetical protein PLC38_03905 [Methanobacterium sp.]|jgi:hypothetical protein|nr:hypothetical protein [Methanobacterium sp.]
MSDNINELKKHYFKFKDKPNPPIYLEKLKRILELEGELSDDINGKNEV